MVFWSAAAILTLLAMACIAVPLLRAPKSVASALDHDREIYRARLSEIDSDLKLGRIGPAEAEAARAEEGRKLLALADTAGAVSAGRQQRSVRFAMIAALVFVPVAAVMLYVASGVPAMPDMAIASRPDRDPANQSIDQLLERAEAQLAQNPNDVRGWMVVAPVYLRLGRVEDSVTAWRNALRLVPGNVDLMTSLGEAIAAQSSGVVTKEARGLFEQALSVRPGDAKARFYLAIALGQEGANAQAAEAWRALIADAPAEAPWLPVAQAQLAAVEGRDAPAAPVAETGRGPTQDDIAAAEDLAPADRQAMIEGMVAGLAERLKDNPQDKEGWRRLVRSYAVLGRPAEATDAVKQARTHFAADTAFLAELDAIAAASPEATQ